MADAPARECVVLVHGLGRTSRSLQALARRLTPSSVTSRSMGTSCHCGKIVARRADAYPTPTACARPPRPARVRSKNPPPFQLTERDIRMLERLYLLRLLDQQQLQRLEFTTGGASACKRRLTLLFHGGYVDRRYAPRTVPYGAPRAAYCLDRRGAELVAAHRGVRTRDRKLVHYYGSGCGQPGASEQRTPEEWELFDLERDPAEMHSVHDDPAYAEDLARLRAELDRLARELGDDIPTTTTEGAT